ncbi:signal transduction histidine kinase [Paenibacillus anaericanus]|uniref:sensor histidine kinase n=1 Tax=Paenibacillus anaericanus TaxID=170367 RepID=UPI0027896437|nr:HAMP domain-containing sensor histidine kinase [Paenibacillus anaericanus]MDQ0089708.1 signal transduction histidine kinase [Paenibacillus anaericanus]
MNKNGEYYFNRVYLVFSILLTVLVLGYTGAILYTVGFNSRIVWMSVLFLVTVFVVGGASVWSLKYRIAGVVNTLDDVIDGAINGQDRVTGYMETNISSLENKLIRYIDLSTTHDKKVEAEKNKIKELISDISHQTKTPLANIVLYSQLLDEHSHSGLDEDTQGFVTQIKSQADKLDWLIQSLIKLSRLETGIISIHATINPIIESISKAVSQVYTHAEHKNIEIAIDCDQAITARHDMKWTSEALFNIMDNAVKYSDTTGKIHITAQANEMFTRIDISDTGIGIDNSELNDIFKRFYRCKATSKYEGVGIGLFLAREIINSQGGYIMASSTVGQGSTFSVYLLRM